MTLPEMNRSMRWQVERKLSRQILFSRFICNLEHIRTFSQIGCEFFFFLSIFPPVIDWYLAATIFTRREKGLDWSLHFTQSTKLTWQSHSLVADSCTFLCWREVGCPFLGPSMTGLSVIVIRNCLWKIEFFYFLFIKLIFFCVFKLIWCDIDKNNFKNYYFNIFLNKK
jgi:hypothetical protein